MIARRSSVLAACAALLAILAPIPPAWAADDQSVKEESKADWPQPIDASMTFAWISFDQLEWRANEGSNAARWDLQGWWGTDENKLWVKSEGEVSTSGPSSGDAEVQLLYSRMLAAFWDVQLGARQDIVFGPGPDRERTFLVMGLEGLAPYWFEVEPALFVSDDGDVSARFAATYDAYVTQRLVAQPRFELNAAASDATGFGVRSGLNDVELGLRLRYEVRRELAPYVGVNWLRRLGDTADLARSEGEAAGVLGLVLGMRVQF